jgi:hypothetical protein
MDGQDLTTCQPDLTPLYAPAQHAPVPSVTKSGVSSIGQVTQELGSSDSKVIYCKKRQDIATGTHVRLATCTR